MIIEAISDLHGYYPELPAGADIVIIAGDLTANDSPESWKPFYKWKNELNVDAVFITPGNHDKACEENGGNLNFSYENLNFYSSPWSLSFQGMNPKCKAFTCPHEKGLEEKFAQIPQDLDILITHTPPYGILDKCQDGKKIGSKALLKAIERVKPKIHIFGHVHEKGGKNTVYEPTGTRCYNVAHVNEMYEPTNGFTRIEV